GNPAMPNQVETSPVIRFATFEVDLQTQELRKRGVRLRLPGQSFQVLKMLLERPGALVTREEFQHALWPSATFVDFAHGLSAVVNRLRKALGDSADSPRFIETLPRRGYRFIGQLAASVPSTMAEADACENDAHKAIVITRRSSVQICPPPGYAATS